MMKIWPILSLAVQQRNLDEILCMRKSVDACLKSIGIDWNIATEVPLMSLISSASSSPMSLGVSKVSLRPLSSIDTVTLFHIDITHACMSASNSHSFKTSYLGKEPLQSFDLKHLLFGYLEQNFKLTDTQSSKAIFPCYTKHFSFVVEGSLSEMEGHMHKGQQVCPKFVLIFLHIF